ncbi:MAG: dTDP-4-dehydrorhamnose reductase [Desulfovibrio sp.]|jgi:dTDP-4-dehydrorhamnose reductase|nr:dTDP-4-dehydrorhamnose reductase [Desulfovibrio sp.]
MNNAQKALVLGGATGLLGQAMVTILRESGWAADTVGGADVDLRAPDAADALSLLVDKLEPSVIVNAIAYTQVDAAEEDVETAFLLNRSLPAMLGRLVKTRGCGLVHFSTDFVFNGKKNQPYTSDDVPDPLCVYGKSKLAGEDALLSLDLPRCLIIRTAWLFGPGKKNFVSTILQLCKQKKSLQVVHDHIGSPTYTLDLAQYTLKLLEAEGSGLFHVVNSGMASWCELASEATRLAQTECLITPVPSSAYPQKATRPAYSVLDCEALSRLTGIVPRPWPRALREYILKAFPPAE